MADSTIPVRTPLAWMQSFWREGLFPQSEAATTKPKLLSLLLLLLLPAWLLYPCLSFHLLEPDEGRYAQIPKEMLERGEWVVPQLMCEPYLDKPPLFYWLLMLSYKAFGISEASARLVPAICVHLTILAVYWLGRRSVGERAAFWAGVLLTVAPGYLGIARFLVLDGLLTLCVTASILCGYEAIRTGILRRGWWLAAAAWSGLGFLTKGPISEVLLFPPLVAFAALSGAAAKIPLRDVFRFAGVVLAVNLPWYVAMGVQRPEFLGYFFWEHNVMRFAKPFDHLQPIWFYVPVLLLGFWPAVPIAFTYARDVLKGHATGRTSHGGFWMLAGLWCLAFFSIGGSKLPTYILPAYPLLALALGESISRSGWNRSAWLKGIVVASALLLGGANHYAVPWYAKERSPMGRPEIVLPYVGDPEVTVVSYPRNVDSVAFYTGRSDISPIRTKDANRLLVESQFRPRTVVLFTHDHSLHGFRENLKGAIDCRVRIAHSTDLRRKDGPKWLNGLLGGGPWGLCDIAVLEPIPPTPAKPIVQAGAELPAK